jgi:carbonic anhydrase
VTSRRRFLAAVPALGLAAGAGAQLAPECEVYTAARRRETTPDQALQALVEGNDRFVGGRTVHCDTRAQVRETAAGPAPFAAVVGCIDSRTAPELVFDRRLGDIVAARVAGNFINDDILGSLELATQGGGVKLIVVLGHSECGAVRNAIDGAKLGYVNAMLRNFAPAIKATRPAGEASGRNPAYVQAVADMHAKLSAAQVVARSEVVRQLVAQRRLRVVAAMHDVASGRVTFFT